MKNQNVITLIKIYILKIRKITQNTHTYSDWIISAGRTVIIGEVKEKKHDNGKPLDSLFYSECKIKIMKMYRYFKYR